MQSTARSAIAGSIPAPFLRKLLENRGNELNRVERWFAEIMYKGIQRGSFRSLLARVRVIKQYLREQNENPHAPSFGRRLFPLSFGKPRIVKKRLTRGTSAIPSRGRSQFLRLLTAEEEEMTSSILACIRQSFTPIVRDE